MDLARVIGTVVCTVKDPAFEGMKLAVVQPLDEELRPQGEAAVAIDSLNRNEGELVYIVRSGDATMGHAGDFLAPTDCAIGGMVDSMHLEQKAPRP